MARFDGTSSPEGPSYDPVQSAADAAVDRMIDGSLRRQFSVPPIAPLPFGPLVPADPVSAGTSGAGGLLAKLLPALGAREAAGLAAALVVWSAAGVLIYNSVDFPDLWRRPAGRGGAWSAVVASASSPSGGMIDRYSELLERPPTSGEVRLMQDRRWAELRETFEQWPDSPLATRLRAASRPAREVRERIELIEVRRGALLGVNAAFVTGRVDGALFVAVIDVPSSAGASLPELARGQGHTNPATADTHYFTAEGADVVAYELTIGSEARFVPALLGPAAPRMERVR